MSAMRMSDKDIRMSDETEKRDLASPSFSRREVLMALGGMGLLAALVSTIRGSLHFLTPPISQAGPSIIAAGPPAGFPPG